MHFFIEKLVFIKKLIMKQSTKFQRLVEVMQKVDKSFKPKLNENNDLNEFFGDSKKREKKEKIETAIAEVMKSRPGSTAFGEPGSDKKEDNDRLMGVRLNLLRQDMRTVSELLPELFDDNQGYINATYLLNGKKIDGYCLSNWDFVIGENNLIEKDNGKEELIGKLKTLY